MTVMDTLLAIYSKLDRQAPGSEASTLRALNTIPNHKNIKNILDIGCGTGAQTLLLAEHCDAQLIAIDLLPAFLAELSKTSVSKGYSYRIHPIQASMATLPFTNNTFDIIWSEASIYNIGFAKGLSYWKNFLTTTGYLIVSELCWLTESRPKEIADYWLNDYAGIATIAEKLKIIEETGYNCLEYFILPESCWTDNYYDPVDKRVHLLKNNPANTPEVTAFLNQTLEESALYRRYNAYYGYVFFVLKPLAVKNTT